MAVAGDDPVRPGGVLRQRGPGMLSESPPFWWQPADLRAWLLWPASFIYGAVAARAMRDGRREPVPAPVLCVGNLTVGGAGKTPVAAAMAEAAREAGRTPGILSRGHGGSFSGVHIVDAEHDSARHVGDEPLLLARHAPVAVSIDRAAAARTLISEGCDFLIMDDGFQSARILIDFALIVVDGGRGIGNGHVIPGGPLRAPVVEQMRYADAVLRLGQGAGAAAVVRQAARSAKPFFEATTVTLDGDRLAGRRFIAFAGIGDPSKFFRSAREAGAEIVVERPFPDHYAYSDEDLMDLVREADKQALGLLTTAKDAVRIRHGSSFEEEVSKRLETLEIEVAFVAPSVPAHIISQTIEAWRKRGGD